MPTNGTIVDTKKIKEIRKRVTEIEINQHPILLIGAISVAPVITVGE